MPDISDNFTREELIKIGKLATVIAVISFVLVWGTVFVTNNNYEEEFDIFNIILLIGIFFVFWSISYSVVLQWYNYKKKKEEEQKDRPLEPQ